MDNFCGKCMVFLIIFLFIGTGFMSITTGNVEKNNSKVIVTEAINNISQTNSKIASSAKEVDWWPQFQKDAVHSGCSLSNAPHTDNLMWKTELGAGGEYCPIVADYKTFVHTWDGYLHALDVKDGDVIWSVNIRNHFVIPPLLRSHIRTLVSSPAYDNGRLFVGSADGWVYCLDALDGKIIWVTRLGLGILGIYGSVTYHDGKVFVGNGDTWKLSIGPDSFGSLYALDANSGDVIWRHFFPRGGILSAPAVHNEMVFIGSLDHNVYAFNEENGEIIWKHKLSGYTWCSPSVADGMVFIGDMEGIIYALDESTGKEVWRFDAGERLYRSTPTVCNGRVYFGVLLKYTYPYGALYCLDEFTGEELWSYRHSHIYPPPIIADGLVFFGSNDQYIHALNASNGAEVWKHGTAGIAQTAGSIADGHLYIGSNDGYLYCFKEID